MILDEYLTTVFHGQPPTAGWPSHFHIITAFNPKRIATDAENNAANTRLVCQLQEQQIPHFRIIGCSADLQHQEASWGVVNLSFEHAIALGRQYVQNAIFEVIEGEAFVVSCDTLERKSIGDFQARLTAPPSNTISSTKRSKTLEEMASALTLAFQPLGLTVKVRRSTPEQSDTTTHRFTFRPFPEKPEEKRHEPDAAPQTIETLKDRIKGLSLQERVDAVSEFYRAKPSLLESLPLDEAAELLGIEFLDDPDERHRWDLAELPEDTDFFEYHEATLTLKAANGGRIVFSTRYNDVKEQRFVNFHRY